MSLPDHSTFLSETICLDKLDDWTVLEVLKQVTKAGYRGAPSKAIIFYRKTLRKQMEKNEPKDRERVNDVFLAAEKAFIASTYDLNLIRFVLNGEEKLDRSKIPPSMTPIETSESCRAETRKKNTNQGRSSPVLRAPAKQSQPRRAAALLRGFIAKPQPQAAEVPEPKLSGSGKRKRAGECAKPEPERPLKIVKKAPARKYKY